MCVTVCERCGFLATLICFRFASMYGGKFKMLMIFVTVTLYGLIRDCSGHYVLLCPFPIIDRWIYLVAQNSLLNNVPLLIISLTALLTTSPNLVTLCSDSHLHTLLEQKLSINLNALI